MSKKTFIGSYERNENKRAINSGMEEYCQGRRSLRRQAGRSADLLEATSMSTRHHKEYTPLQLDHTAERTIEEARAIREGGVYYTPKGAAEPVLNYPQELIDKIATEHDREKERPVTLFVECAFKEKITEKKVLEKFPPALLALPTGLRFTQGINLIVGPNGSGKSTLLNSLRYSMIDVRSLSDREHVDNGYIMLASSALKLKTSKYSNAILLDNTIDWKNYRSSDSMAFLFASPLKTRSQRYARELAIKMKSEKVGRETPILIFIDEPEMGLDPWRKKELEDQLMKLFHPESTFIVATNSETLLASDLPRIDLRNPEKGVFIPQHLSERI